jgi:anti-anti-sigma regulatory factor
VVVRVVGRGDLGISPQLKTLGDQFNRADYSPHYILDLERCFAMDSTFMGAIAALALHQMACLNTRMVVVNASANAQSQLEKLGLKYILDLRHGLPEEVAPVGTADFRESPSPARSRFDRIVHMMESHRALIDANSGNEIVFRPVLERLGESLEREKSRAGTQARSDANPKGRNREGE